MDKKDVLTKILAIAGTVLAWFPFLAPALISVVTIIRGHIFRFDYLMPAELFLFALAGGGLLLWAALRAHAHYKVIGWGLGIAIVFLVGGQVLAVVTGLATGETGPGGWQWVLVLASLSIYSLAVLGVAIDGILLIQDLFKKSAAGTGST